MQSYDNYIWDGCYDFNKIHPMVEYEEIKFVKGKHRTKFNGPDGFGKEFKYNITNEKYNVNVYDKIALEIKAQYVYYNRKHRKILFFGRKQYSNVNLDLYDEKIKSNERIITIGFIPDKNVILYRFSFNFDAIADDYLKIALNNEKYNRNIGESFGWLHYMKHESFKCLMVASTDNLIKYKHLCQPKFFKFLTTFNKDFDSVNNTHVVKERSNVLNYSIAR
jgi:hypothetical protein